MNKTKFYESVINHFCNHDINNMMSYMGAKNYESIIEDNIIDNIDLITNDLNEFFEKIELNYRIDKTATIDLMKDRLKPHYSGKMMISIHYQDLYEHLLDKNIISADQEISIYRIESKDFQGFYRHFENIGRPLTERFDFETSESPGCDGVLSLQFMNSDYRDKSSEKIFGFKDSDALGKWLVNTEGLAEEVAVEELYMSEYKVKEKDVLITPNQAAFSEKNSRCVGRIPIGEFLKGRLEQARYKEKMNENPNELNEDKEVINFLKSKNGDVVVTKKKKRKSKKDNFKNNNQLNLF